MANKVLTQDEIDAMLKAAMQGQPVLTPEEADEALRMMNAMLDHLNTRKKVGDTIKVKKPGRFVGVEPYTLTQSDDEMMKLLAEAKAQLEQRLVAVRADRLS